ncbi:MAG: hypothetical protein FP816_06275 [Desulfobacteraceae bacterium]|nr:hypothetical protein [Desulfobacteraceae bacterium]MBU4055556.1 hypothetical protein [Pseudomonadota bacterium]
MKKTRMMLLFIFWLLTGVSFAGAEQPKGALWAMSDGQGTISLFWIPKDLVWPAGGWSLEKEAGGKTVIVSEKIDSGTNQAVMDKLSTEDQAVIRKFRGELKSGTIAQGEQEIAVTVMGLSAAIKSDFGLALGLRFVDSDPGPGSRSYHLTALNAKGEKQSVLSSVPVDPNKATPLPIPPALLVGEPSEAGVDLTWENPPQNQDQPVVGFAIEREDGKSDKVLLTDPPILITEAKTQGPKVRFVDNASPKETEATYRIFSIDFFGRRSLPQSQTLFVPDLSALIPPGEVVVTSGKNQADFSWKPNPSPFTSGYVVERGLLRNGPFTVMTPDGLDAQQSRWEDKDLVGGTSYFYHVRSMDPRGNLGPPSQLATATPQNREAPPSPGNLRAEVGRTRVRLTWDSVKFPIAGYKVERLAKDAGRWTILTSTVIPEPLFDDQTGLHTRGEFSYRIIAVALDNQESPPSREVKAVLLDTVSPNPPRITDIDGSNGRVVITFKASPPETDVNTFLVVRSVSEEDPGLVIGDPLPAKNTRFEDTFVGVGKKYWYRLVAVDKTGNRSDLSRAREVIVLNPPIPIPPKPALTVEQEPLRHVKISFAFPPNDLEVIIQRFEDGQGWRPLTGGIRNASDAVDLSPLQQKKVRYRLIYRAANGVIGEPSPEVEAQFE